MYVCRSSGSYKKITWFLAVNFFADPFAVKQLLIQGQETGDTLLPLDRFILLPLDITTPHELPFPFYKDKVDPSFETSVKPSDGANKSSLVHFTSSFLESAREVMLQFGNDAMELHDIVAVWCAIENPPRGDNTLASGWKAWNRTFDIERSDISFQVPCFGSLYTLVPGS